MQEVFGDVRKYAVPGAPREARRDALNEYLQHPAALAAAAPPEPGGGEVVRRRDLRPARERRVAVRERLRLHARPGRADAGLRLGAGLRGPLRRQRALRLRVAADEPRRLRRASEFTAADRRDPRPARRRDRRLVRVARGRLRHRLVQPRPRRRELHDGWRSFSTWTGAPGPTRRRRRRRSPPARPGSSRSTTATFAFTADEDGADFECSLDGAPFAPCASPAAYTGLAAGAHHFEVRAIDPPATPTRRPRPRDWTIVPGRRGPPASGAPTRATARAARPRLHRAGRATRPAAERHFSARFRSVRTLLDAPRAVSRFGKRGTSTLCVGPPKEERRYEQGIDLGLCAAPLSTVRPRPARPRGSAAGDRDGRDARRTRHRPRSPAEQRHARGRR